MCPWTRRSMPSRSRSTAPKHSSRSKRSRRTGACWSRAAPILPAPKTLPGRLTRQVLALSRPDVQSQSTSGATTIDVYAPYQSDWTDVEGNTAPNIAVSMRILRGTKIVWTETGVSDAQGYYRFSPEWTDSCSSDLAHTWKVIPGDVVEITAGGARVSTVVARVVAWVDPVSNIVAGETDAYRKVTVFLHSAGIGCCVRPRAGLPTSPPAPRR